MAKVILPAGGISGSLAHLAGSNRQELTLERDQTLDVPDVTQPALDAALIDYVADQATHDADYQDILDDEVRDRDKDEFDDDSIVTAIIKEMVEQLNDIRGNAGMPLLTFGTVNSNIRNRIGQP